MGKAHTPATVFIVYNRPELTAQSLAMLAQARPTRLFVVADGPRQNVVGDAEKCAEVISLIQSIDWPCEISYNIAPSNMGCRRRTETGLSWVFDQVTEALVVEDDCVVDPSFFPFAAELLRKYADDPAIGIISAQGDELTSPNGSYHVSNVPLFWGWASWRRVWRTYEPDLATWPQVRESDWLLLKLGDPLSAAYWRGIFDAACRGLDTWDYGLVYSCWRNDMLAIHPSINMVENIGFGADATHTLWRSTPFALHRKPMQVPLEHPAGLAIDAAREARLLATHFGLDRQEALRRARQRINERSDAQRL